MIKRQHLVQDLAQNLECPVCFEIPQQRPIFTCEIGHLVCARCHGMLNSCPICRGAFRGTRSFIAESLVTTINKLVCGSPIALGTLPNGRTSSSPSNLVRCCLAVNGCRNRMIDASNYIDHLKTTHGVFVARSATGKFVHKVLVSSMGRTLVKRGIERLFVLEISGKSFVINMFQDGNEIRIWAQTELTADGSLTKVRFMICTTTKNEKISWTGAINGHQVTEKSVRIAESCMIVPFWTLKDCLHIDDDESGGRYWNLDVHIYSSTAERLRAHPVCRKIERGVTAINAKITWMRHSLKGITHLFQDFDTVQGPTLHRIISDGLILFAFAVLLVFTMVVL